jgi:O-antigen/teichoic acid export membrane protein/GGDEF domain-containing protein
VAVTLSSAMTAPDAPPPDVPPPDAPPPDAPSGETQGSLREVAVRSGAYLAGREGVGMVVRLAGLVVVVRQIGPSAFGIYSAAAAFVFFAAALAQMGAEVFLIRMPGPLPRRKYDEVFTFLLCTSAIVVAVGLGLSYAAGPWLRPVGVATPMRVLLLSVPINILWAPAQACIERKFAYRRMGLLELGGDVALYGTAVPLALRGAGAWSLVAGYFAWQAWLLVGSAVLAGQRPRLAWSSEASRALLRHGRSYAASTWIQGARSSVITLIVGTLAGAAGVGYVNFAQRLVTTLNFTTRGVHRVGMVAISRASKGAPERLAGAVEEGTLLLMLVAALPFAAFGLVAHWAIPEVFGRDWLPALPLYVLLALWAVLRVPVTVQRTLLYAHGRNAPPAVTSMIELVVVSGVSIVAVHALGIVGFGIASVVAVGSTAYTHHAARKLVAVRYRRLVVPLLGLVPPVLVPLLPMPWAFALLVTPVMLVVQPSTRREVCGLVSTARTIVSRRRATAQPAPRAGATAPVALPYHRVLARAPVEVMSPLLLAPAPGDGLAEGERDVALDGRSAHRVYAGHHRWEPPSPSPLPTWGWDGGRPAPGGAGVAASFHAEPPGAATRTWAVDAGRSATPGPMVAGPMIPGPVVAGPMVAGPVAWPDPVLELLLENDPVTGLPSAGVLLARTGRLLGAARRGGWQLLVVAIGVGKTGVAGVLAPPSERVLATAAAALRAELRFDDPVARIGPSMFVAAVAFVPGGVGGPEIAAHLRSAVAAAVAAPHAGSHDGAADHLDGGVRVSHVVTALPSDEEADDLVRKAVDGARA